MGALFLSLFYGSDSIAQDLWRDQVEYLQEKREPAFQAKGKFKNIQELLDASGNLVNQNQDLALSNAWLTINNYKIGFKTNFSVPFSEGSSLKKYLENHPLANFIAAALGHPAGGSNLPLSPIVLVFAKVPNDVWSRSDVFGLYDPNTRFILIPISENGNIDYEVFVHELLHAIDHLLGTKLPNGAFRKNDGNKRYWQYLSDQSKLLDEEYSGVLAYCGTTRKEPLVWGEEYKRISELFQENYSQIANLHELFVFYLTRESERMMHPEWPLESPRYFSTEFESAIRDILNEGRFDRLLKKK